MAVKKQQLEMDIKVNDKSSKPLKEISSTARRLTKETQNASAAVKEQERILQEAQAELDRLGDSYQTAAAASERLATSIESSNSSITNLYHSFLEINAALHHTLSNINNMARMLDTMLSQEFLKRIEDVLKIMSAIAKIKGFDSISEKLLEMSHSIEAFRNFIGDIEKKMGTTFGSGDMKSFSDILSSLGDTATTFFNVLNGIRKILMGILTVGVALAATKLFTHSELGALAAHKAFEKVNHVFPVLGTNLNHTRDMLENVSSSMRMQGDIVRTSFRKNLFGLSEIFYLLSPQVSSLALGLATLDSEFMLVASSAFSFANAINTVFMIALTATLRAVSGVFVDFGNTLTEAMTGFEEKFKKAEVTAKQFGFVIGGLSNEFGDEFTGGIDKWTNKLSELQESSKFAADDLSKAIKMIVAEGVRFGLSVTEIDSLISRTVDVSSAYGESVVDMARKMNSAFAGNTMGLTQLGFAVSDASNYNSEYFRSLNKTTDELNKVEKALVKYEMIMSETASVTGAAANELDTIAGATASYERALTSLQVRLGSMGAITRAFIVAKTKLLELFIALPGPIVDTIGFLIDFGGTVFVVGGTILKYLLTLSTMVAVYKFLDAAIAASAMVQGYLNNVFTKAAAIYGVNTIQVTSLRTAMINLVAVMKGVAISTIGSLRTILASLGTTLVTVTAKVWAFTASLLANPLFLKAAAIVAVLSAFVVAIKEIYQEVESLQEAFAFYASAFGFASDKTEKGISIYQKFMGVIKVLVRAFVDLVKFGIGSFLTGLQAIITGVTSAVAKLAGVFGVMGVYESLTERADEHKKVLKELAAVTKKAGDSVFGFGSNVAYAALGLDEYGRKVKDNSKIINDLVKSQLSGFDEIGERINVLGDEYEKAYLRQQKAVEALTKAKESTLDVEEKAKGIAEATKEVTLARINSEKLLEDSLIKIRDERFRMDVEELKRSGLMFAAIEREGAARVESIQKQIDGLEKLGILTEESRTDLELFKVEVQLENIRKVEEETKRFLDESAKAVEALTEKGRRAYVESLRASEQTVKALKLEQAEKLKAFDEEVEALDKKINLGNKEREAIAAARAEIVRGNLVQVYQEEQKVLEKTQKSAIQAFEKLAGSRESLIRDIAKQGQTESEAIEVSLALRMKEISETEKQLAGVGALTEARKKELDEVRKLSIEYARLQKASEHVSKLKEVSDATKQINRDILLSGMTGIEQVETMLDIKLQELDALEEQLRLTKSLTDARKADIDAARNAAKSQAAADIKKQTGGADTGTIKALQGIGMNISSLAAPMMAVIDAVQGIVGILQKIVDAVPALFNAVAGLLNSITELPQELVRSLGNLLSSLSRFYKEFITNLIKALGDIPEMLANFLIDVPNLIGNALTKTIPEALLTLVDRMPEIVEKFVMGFVMAMPKIAMAFVQFLIIELPRIMWEITKMMPQLAIAFLNGIWEGIKELGSMLWDFFTGGDFFSGITEDIGSSLKDAWDGIANETSQLFNVKDLSEQVKGFDMADRIGAAVKSGFTSGVNFLKRAWEGFVQALKDAWMWIRTNIVDPIVNAIKNAWIWVRDEIINPMLDSIKAAWVWIRDNIINPVIEAIKIAWVWIRDKIINPVIEGIKSAWLWIRDKIINPVIEGIKSAWVWIRDKIVTPMTEGIKSAWLWIRDNIITPLSNFVSNMGANIKSAFANIGETFKTLGTKIWEGLKEKLSGIGDFFKNIFDSINPANLFSKIFAVDYKGKGAVETALGIDIPFLNFAQGGTVPGQALVPGDSLMNDRILALLSPGEAVVPRSVMNDPVLGQLVRAVINGDYNPPKFAYGISDLIDDVTGGGSAVLDFLGIPNPWEFVKDKIMNEMILSMFEINKFHNGGLVLPQFAKGGEVPALLQPGEFVINRQATAQNFGTLSAMNSGGFSGGLSGGIVIEKIEINARTNLDADGIRKEVIPAIEKHLLKKSQNGQRVLDPAGVRK